MQTRRDHVQAYKFATGQLSAALVGGNPGTGEAPMRRSGLGVLFGVAIALLMCGALWVYGLINPGGATSWQQAGSIIVEKETGNRYIYVNGTLYPTLNLSSAMLYFANGDGHIVDVSQNSLTGVPHGSTVGIPGAPDSVPASSGLLPGAWSLCAAPGSAGAGMTIDFDSTDTVGAIPPVQRLVVTSNGADYVVWRNVAYPVPSSGALLALGLADVAPIAVSPTWLAALRSGPALAAPQIPGAGGPGPVLADGPTVIGQVLSTSIGGATQYYLLREDGAMPLSRTAMALLTAAPGALPVRPVTPAALAALPISKDNSLLSGIPDLVDVPTYQPGNAAVCVRQTSSGTSVAPGSLVLAQVAVPNSGTAVNVPSGKAVYAYALPLVPNRAPNVYLITDQGLKFLLPSPASTALKLTAAPVGLPSTLLAAMPSGPTLLAGNSALTTTTGGQ